MLKNAFTAVSVASCELERCRALIAELHYKVEQVENAQFLLDNIGRWADPSDDAHEILFSRLSKAEKDLSDYLSLNTQNTIGEIITKVEKSISEAKQKVSSV